MYIMCVCLFSALSRRVGALQMPIIIIITIIVGLPDSRERNNSAEEELFSPFVCWESCRFPIRRRLSRTVNKYSVASWTSFSMVYSSNNKATTSMDVYLTSMLFVMTWAAWQNRLHGVPRVHMLKTYLPRI